MTSGAPHPLARLQTTLVPVDQLYRLSTRPGTEPYFGTKGIYRFDSPTGAFGVLYCGGTAKTAFAESVLHSAASKWDPLMGAYLVTETELSGRHLVSFTHPAKAELLMADFTGEALKRLGLNNDISATKDYSTTQKLAEDVHAFRTDLDGIRFVSRQLNTQFCYAIFDRSGLTRGSSAPLTVDQVNALCQDFNVTVMV